MNASNVLSQLRDIHLPPPVSIWPLAWGWYVLLIVLLLLGSCMLYWSYQRWNKLRRRQFILNELQRLEANWMDKQQRPETIGELSILLRRVALAIFPRQEVAGLNGDAWLQFLDRTANTQQFTQGEGRVLVTAPYQRQRVVVSEQLFILVREWIQRNV